MPKFANLVSIHVPVAVPVVSAAHTPDNVSSEDPSTEVAPEATGAQMKVLDELEVADGEKLLALWRAAAVYEQRFGHAGPLASCHSLMPNEWGSICFFRRIVQSLLGVLRT